MANWSNPLLTSTYTNFVTEVKDRDTDLALQFDGTTSTNIPTGTIRWNSSANRWQKWSGTAWGELTSTYALTGLSTTGNASIGGTLSVTGATSLGTATATTPATSDNSTNIATTAYVKAQSLASLNSPAFTGTPTAPTAAVGTNTTQLATTAYVVSRIVNDALLLAGGTLTGAVAVIAGTATAGGIQVGTGTTYKPGIYSPGADQVAISTSGTGRLIINSTGQISIPHTVTSLTTTIAINNTDSTSGTGNRIALQSNGTNVAAFDWDYTGGVFNTNISSYGGIIFKTSGASPTEKLRITSGGLVGIGVTNPSKLLHVQSGSVSGAARGGTFTKTLFESSDATATYWEFQAASTATNDFIFSKGNTGSYGIVGYDHVNDALRFYSNATERMRIDSSGNVGIGGTTALTGSRLYVQQTGESYSGGQSSYNSLFPAGYIQVLDARNVPAGTVNSSLLVFSNTNSNGNTQAYIGSLSGNSDNAPAAIVFGQKTSSTVWSERMRIDTSGRLLVGTTAPPAGASIKLTLDGVNGGGIELVQNNNGGCAIVPGSGGGIQFYTFAGAVGSESYSEAARFDAQRRLLVGVSSVSFTCRAVFQGHQADGVGATDVYFQSGTAAASVLSGNGLGTLSFAASGSRGAYITTTADANWTASSFPTSLVFATAPSGSATPTEQMRLDSSGNLKFNSGYGSVVTAYGCRAWVSFDGTTSSPNTIRGSGNVSSVTKNGTGDYTVNFATAMVDTNYSFMVTAGMTNLVVSPITGGASLIAAATSSRRFMLSYTSSLRSDMSEINVTVHR